MSALNHPPSGVEPQERRLRSSWWLFAASFFVLGLLVVLRVTTDQARPIDLVLAALVVIVGLAAVLHRNAVHELEVGRRAEAESLARILQGLSRSISPDAIVDAIVEELGIGTGADHIVVVRRQEGGTGLTATLVSTRPGVPSSTTLFPLSDLEDALAEAPPEREPVAVPVAGDPPLELGAAVASAVGAAAGGAAGGATGAVRPGPRVLAGLAPRSGGSLRDLPTARSVAAAIPSLVRSGAERLGAVLPSAAPDGSASAGPISRARRATAADRVAERIADRARSAYGLRNTLAEPLRTRDGVIGAIVLSRRVAEPWPASARRILAGAASEASAALARATQHRDAESRATTDALTGLPNRGYFDEFCGLLARRRRADDAVGILLVDIDWFKVVNDTWGHAAGDQVLRAVAAAIVSAVREEDVPARFGGEEFVVLLRNPGVDVAIEVAERVRAAVGTLDMRRIGPAGVTVSVGLAVSTTPDQPIDDLIAAADRALYEAKRQGRDRVVAAG